MAFDKKAWETANAAKVKLYAARYRLKRRGIDPDAVAPIPTLTPEQKAVKKAEARERYLAAKRLYDATHREEKARRYRERYENDPEFRARQHEKRRHYYWANKKVLSDEEKAARLRQRQEALAKARKILNAQRHEAAMLRGEEMEAKKRQKSAASNPSPLTSKKKPGRLLALCGWKGF